MFSWLTGSGVLKKDEFEDDRTASVEYYQNDGYIDFAILDTKYVKTAPNRMVIHVVISEGRQYKVGNLAITGNTIFTTNDFIKGKLIGGKLMILTNVPGAIFKPAAFDADVETIRDMYGSKGYLSEFQNGNTVIRAARTPNIANGTMDIAINIQEGDTSITSKKLTSKATRKPRTASSAANSPSIPAKSITWSASKSARASSNKWNTSPRWMSPPMTPISPTAKTSSSASRKQSMSSATIGAGFSSIESIVGYAEVKIKNFDLFNPPTFTGAGQKLQLIASIGSLYQDYEIAFTEPYFLGKKLVLGVDLFHRKWITTA